MERKNIADVRGDGNSVFVGKDIKVRSVRTRVHKENGVPVNASKTDGNASAKNKTWKEKLTVLAQSSSVASFILNILRALKIVP